MDAASGVATSTAEGGWKAALAVAAAILAVNLVLAPWTTLWDRDEPYYAQAAVEMARSGNLLYATFNGEVFPEKPPLLFWLMGSSIAVLGAGELAVRCWSPVGLALAALFTFAVGRRRLSSRAGLLAMVILATNPMASVQGIAATTDALLLAAVTGALAVFSVMVERGVRWWAVPTLAVALAVGLLLKGPAGLVPVPVMAVAWWLAGRRGERSWPVALAVVAATALGVVVFMAWALPADAATGGLLAREGLGHHVLRRALTPLEGHGGHLLWSLPYYLPVIAIGFLPWTLHLPGALHALGRGALGGRRTRALLLSWTLVPLVGFSLAATKLPHYVLPIWPALALTVAGTLEAAREGRLEPRSTLWMRRGLWLYLPLVVATLGLVVAAAVAVPTAGARTPLLLLAIGLAVATVPVVRAQRRAQPWRSTPLIVGVVLAAQLTVGLWVAPLVDRLKPVPKLAEAIRSGTTNDVPVAALGFREPSLVFALDRVPVTWLPTPEATADWAREEAPGILVLERSTLEELQTRCGPLPLAELAGAEGLNVTDGRWLELVAVMRGGSLGADATGPTPASSPL